MNYYNLFIKHFHKDVKKEDIEEFKKIAIINKDEEEAIIEKLKEEINKGDKDKKEDKGKKKDNGGR